MSGKSSKPTSASSAGSNAPQSNAANLLKINNLKMQRYLDENNFKVLKWNFTTPNEKFIEQLRVQMNTAGMNKTLITNMFHQNFKFRLKVIDSLSEDVTASPAALISNLDLVLKWLTLRFFDTNPSVILRSLEYLKVVFRVLAEEGYNMMEVEAASFLPYLVLKIGDYKDTVRNLVKDIFDVVGSIYSISKLFTYIMDGLKSRYARQRTGCLEQLNRLIENYGLSVCQPSPAAVLKKIAKQISDRDNSVRNAALNCVIAAYFIAGEKIRQMIGRISDKDMSLLDERIKRASKSRPVATEKPTQYSSAKRNSQCESSPSRINNNTYNCNSDDEMSVMNEPEQVAPTIPLENLQQEQRRKRFSFYWNVIEANEATAIVHPKPNLPNFQYDDNYLTETMMPLGETRELNDFDQQIINGVFRFFSTPVHAENVFETQLQQLLAELVNLLVEKRLENSENSNVLQEVVNKLLLKILECSDHTVVICRLFQMLYESVVTSIQNQNYQELIMRCIWKTIKYIPVWGVDLDYTKVLTEIHRFLTDFSSNWWKKQTHDTPLRTYKAMVHALVIARRCDILTVVNFIPGFNEQCELYHYINKLLRVKHMKLKENTDDLPDKTKYHMPRALHVELSQILKKIRDEEETQQGLRMLYDFKREHPEINISQFLSKTSRYFEQYVLRGLEDLQAEKAGKILLNEDDKCIERNNENNLIKIENVASESIKSDAQRYKQKLETLQQRAGCNQCKKPGSAPTLSIEQPSNLVPTLRITSPRKRLYRDADKDCRTVKMRKLSELKSRNF